MKKINVVENAVNKNLCMGCGACYVVCPKDAISIVYNKSLGQYVPDIDNRLCINCGKCYKVCPGIEVNFKEMNENVYGKQPDNMFLGNYHKVFIARSLNKDIAECGASGGFVTQFLINLIEQKIIDGVVVCRKNSIYTAEVIFTKDTEEIKRSQRSVYTNVPIVKKLKEVIESGEKIAIVALHCHLHGIHKLLKYYPQLKNQIVFTIGLFCGGTYRGNSIERFLKNKNLKSSDIEKLDFRYGKWPGKMRIIMKNGRELFYKRDKYFSTNYLNRCFYCYDFLCDFADVSVGDNWLKKSGSGENIIIIRKPNRKEYFQNIQFNEISAKKLYFSHKLTTRRSRYHQVNSNIGRLFLNPVPKTITDKVIKASWKNYLQSFLDFIQIKIGKKSDFFIKYFLILKSHIVYHIIQKNIRKKFKPIIKKNKTILITEGNIAGNKGAVAMTQCIINYLKTKLPDTKFVILTSFKKEEAIIQLNEQTEIITASINKYNISLLKLWTYWLFLQIGIELKILLKDKILKMYQKSEMVLSVSGISFNEETGNRRIYHYSKYLQIPLLLNKKVVKFTQTIGPFYSKYNKKMASLTLPFIDCIQCRGKFSLNNLKEIGIENNVKLYPDIALTLEKKVNEELNNILLDFDGKEIIGISPNIVCENLDESGNYFREMKRLIIFINETYKESQILLIPHTIYPNKRDDMDLCIDLIRETQLNDVKIVNTTQYSAEETKYLISRCNFFIGSRFHSLIAAQSCCVPCIAIGWHEKYKEMMDWVRIENNVIYFWEFKEKDLVQFFLINYQNKQEIIKAMVKNIPELKKKAMKAIDEVIEVYNND
jgi:coenzyme F420 hydrogenase subunit beta